MYFSTSDILPIVYIAAGVIALTMLWLLWPYRKKITLTAGDNRHTENSGSDSETEEAAGELPPVSVIIYASYNPDELEEMLPTVLQQQYPGEFEVIVVNDGTSPDLTDVVKRASHEYSNLRHTFVPEEAHNLSRKKLAISLGIKAAKYPHVILTTASAKPASLQWLAMMGHHFAEGKQVVLGWGRISGIRRQMTAFDQVATGTTWLRAATDGHPYRGTAFNIGYSRRLFFNSKGFSRSMNLHNGDDDIFISQIADAENTAVELNPGARVNVKVHNPLKVWREEKLNHTFTARFLPKWPRMFLGISTLMMWLWTAAMTAGIVFSLPNALPGCVFLLMIPALWIPLTKAWRRTGRTLGVRLHAPLLWWQMMWRWVPDLSARIRCNRGERRNYTWWQKK